MKKRKEWVKWLLSASIVVLIFVVFLAMVYSLSKWPTVSFSVIMSLITIAILVYCTIEIKKRYFD